MMPPLQNTPETIILVDNPDLFSAGIKAIQSRDYKAQITQLPSGGTGFTRSYRFQHGERCFNLLYLAPENAHPFAYLTLGQRAMAVPVERVICIGQAVALDDTYTKNDKPTDDFPARLHPGDIATISEAIAVPYPALYESQPPPWQPSGPQEHERRLIEKYPLSDKGVAAAQSLTASLLPHLWQKHIPVIRSGYAKHPTRAGALAPWAPEQFAHLRDSGIVALAELPTGAGEFALQNPSIQVMAFTMITATVSEASASGSNSATRSAEWQRYRHKLLYGALQLILSSLSHNSSAEARKV